MPAKVIWLRGTQIGKEFQLGSEPCTIGRESSNTIVVGSGRASRRHAMLRADAGGYVLSDLGSGNGTLVNGQQIKQEYRLRSGDLFEIGDELFRYEAGEAYIASTLKPENRPIKPKTSPPTPRPSAPSSTPPPAQQPMAPRSRPTLPWKLIIAGVVLLIAILFFVWVVSGQMGGGLPSFSSTTASGIQTPDEWTILAYVAADNDLEADALRDLHEMELIGSTDQVRIVVQLDRGGQAGALPRWDTARRYLIGRDDDPDRINSAVLRDLGQINTGDPQALADFLVWGVQSFPAKRYGLVIWDHGSAWAGIAGDVRAGGDTLSLPELEQALASTQAQLNGRRFDLIGFDACLMAQLDVLLAVAPYGDIAVASADLVPNDGWAWDAWLSSLTQTPSQNGRELAEAAVQSYQAAYQPRNLPNAMLAAFDLSQIPTLASQTGALADLANNTIDQSYRPLANARAQALIYSQPRTEEFSAVDLGDLLTRLVANQPGAALTEQAMLVQQTLSQVRIAAWQGSNTGSGMSIFFPEQAALLPNAYEQASPLARQTNWVRFLRVYHAAGTALVAEPQIADLQASASPDGGVLTQGTLVGRDLAAVLFFIGIPNGARDGVRLVDVAFIPAPGSDPQRWADGFHPLQQRWQATQWRIDAGTGSVAVLLGPIRQNSDLYGVEGIYAAQGSEPIDAALLFRMEGDQAIFQSMYGFPRDQSQAAQPFEIQPEAGDRFTVQFRTYRVAQDGSHQQLIPGRELGETLTFGDQTLQASRQPATAGAYVAGFLVRDIAGRFSYIYRDIEVQ
ncbi:MAG: hypothetical protein Fur005_28870 [Roseiflexaceae bacterium]